MKSPKTVLPGAALATLWECHHSGFSIGRRQRAINGQLMGFKRVFFHDYPGLKIRFWPLVVKMVRLAVVRVPGLALVNLTPGNPAI